MRIQRYQIQPGRQLASSITKVAPSLPCRYLKNLGQAPQPSSVDSKRLKLKELVDQIREDVAFTPFVLRTAFPWAPKAAPMMIFDSPLVKARSSGATWRRPHVLFGGRGHSLFQRRREHRLLHQRLHHEALPNDGWSVGRDAQRLGAVAGAAPRQSAADC